jgi:hypothetical protein
LIAEATMNDLVKLIEGIWHLVIHRYIVTV